MNDIMVAISGLVLLVLLIRYVWPRRKVKPWAERPPWQVDRDFFKWEEEHEVSKCACPRPYKRMSIPPHKKKKVGK